MPYELFLLGVVVVFNILLTSSPRMLFAKSQHSCRTAADNANEEGKRFHTMKKIGNGSTTWERSGQEGIRKYLLFPSSSHFPLESERSSV